MFHLFTEAYLSRRIVKWFGHSQRVSLLIHIIGGYILCSLFILTRMEFDVVDILWVFFDEKKVASAASYLPALYVYYYRLSGQIQKQNEEQEREHKNEQLSPSLVGHFHLVAGYPIGASFLFRFCRCSSHF